MKSKRSSLNSSRGFTAIELVVATGIGLGIVLVTLGLTQSSHFVLGQDMARTRLNQNLRGTLDILSSDLRIAGENLSDSFPVFVLANSSAGDQLTVRRGLLSNVLLLCKSVGAGASVSALLEVANTSALAGCDVNSNKFAHNKFIAARTADGGSKRGYILNTATDKGEYFNYIGETASSNLLTIRHDKSSWANAYPTGATAIYLIEEHRYFLDSDRIKRIVNEDATDQQTISFGITSFQSRVVLVDGTEKLSFGPSDTWTDIKYLELTVGGSERFAGNTLRRSVTGRFFPRNVLSE